MADYVRIFLIPKVAVHKKAERNKKGTITVSVTDGKFDPKEEESFVEFLPGSGVFRKNGKNQKMKEVRRMRIKARVFDGDTKIEIKCKPIGERGGVYYAALKTYTAGTTKFAIVDADNLSDSPRRPPIHRDIPARP